VRIDPALRGNCISLENELTSAPPPQQDYWRTILTVAIRMSQTTAASRRPGNAPAEIRKHRAQSQFRSAAFLAAFSKDHRLSD
jgi:hypothetical protein